MTGLTLPLRLATSSAPSSVPQAAFEAGSAGRTAPPGADMQAKYKETSVGVLAVNAIEC